MATRIGTSGIRRVNEPAGKALGPVPLDRDDDGL
jgi:hypothetical protein